MKTFGILFALAIPLVAFANLSIQHSYRVSGRTGIPAPSFDCPNGMVEVADLSREDSGRVIPSSGYTGTNYVFENISDCEQAARLMATANPNNVIELTVQEEKIPGTQSFVHGKVLNVRTLFDIK